MFLSWRRRPLGLKSATAPEDAKRASDEVEAQRKTPVCACKGLFRPVRRCAAKPSPLGGVVARGGARHGSRHGVRPDNSSVMRVVSAAL